MSSRGPRKRAFMAAGYSFFSHLLEHNGDGGGGASPYKTLSTLCAHGGADSSRDAARVRQRTNQWPVIDFP